MLKNNYEKILIKSSTLINATFLHVDKNKPDN